MHAPKGQQCLTRSMTSHTLKKSNTIKGSSAKSCLESPRHARIWSGEACSFEQLVQISKRLDPSVNFNVLRWTLRKRARIVCSCLLKPWAREPAGRKHWYKWCTGGTIKGVLFLCFMFQWISVRWANCGCDYWLQLKKFVHLIFNWQHFQLIPFSARATNLTPLFKVAAKPFFILFGDIFEEKWTIKRVLFLFYFIRIYYYFIAFIWFSPLESGGGGEVLLKVI